jgi:hypothetical protein
MQDQEDALHRTQGTEWILLYRNNRAGGITWGQEDIWDLTDKEDGQD